MPAQHRLRVGAEQARVRGSTGTDDQVADTLLRLAINHLLPADRRGATRGGALDRPVDKHACPLDPGRCAWQRSAHVSVMPPRCPRCQHADPDLTYRQAPRAILLSQPGGSLAAKDPTSQEVDDVIGAGGRCWSPLAPFGRSLLQEVDEELVGARCPVPELRQ